MPRKSRKKKTVEIPTPSDEEVAELKEKIENRPPAEMIIEAEAEKPKTRIVYKTDARYEVLRDAVSKALQRRPDIPTVQRNPMAYHEWALALERLLQ